MNYLLASLVVAGGGVATVLAVGGDTAQHRANCRDTEKGSIVATINCPELPEKAAVTTNRPFDRAKALAHARGAPDRSD